MPKPKAKPARSPKHRFVPCSFNLEPALAARVAKVAGPRNSSAFAREALWAAVRGGAK